MMATSPLSEVRETIGRLIDVCRDAQFGFELAARGVAGEPILKAELLQYSGQRQEFVADLNDALRRAGQEPIPQATPGAETPRPADIDDEDFARLEQAVLNHDRAAILTECEHAESAAADAYRRASSVSDLPVALSATIAVQLNAINRVHDRMQSLLDVTETDPTKHR